MNDDAIEPSEGPGRMLTELEASIASQLEDSEGRLRRQPARGRLIGAVSLAATERSTILLVHTALAAARMLRRPVLVLDLTPSVAFPSHARELPSLSDLASRPGLLAEHDAFARTLGATVAIARAGTGAEPSVPAIVDVLAALTARYALVITHTTPGSAARAALARVADAGVAIGLDREAGMLRRARLPGEREVIVLSDGAAAATEGDRQALSDACRADVLAIVPGATIPLLRDDAAEAGAAEPWRSVDRLARHMLQRTVGIALGAGASGTLAHLGVLAALEDLGVTIDSIAAAGTAAPIATGAALGMSASDLRAGIEETFRLLARPRMPWAAPGDDAALRAAFDAMTGGRRFEDLDMPLGLAATDLDRGETVVLHQGTLADAMLASMAMPGVLAPVEIDGRRLIDGGALDPVPADVLARAGADIVIGVHIGPATGLAMDGGWRSRLRQPAVESVVRAFDLMRARIATAGAAPADITIAPAITGRAGLGDWTRADEMIASGRAAVEAIVPRLRARLALDASTMAMPERIAA